MSTVTSPDRTARGISAPLLIGSAFVLSTVANICFQLADILFTDRDPYRAEGPIPQITSIAVVGLIGLALALVVAVPLSRTPGRAKVGAIVLGALSLITAPFFWSGAPAVLGAAAAWLAGLTKGGRPLPGAARGFGIVGFVVAVLVVVGVFVGGVGALVTGR